MSKQIIKFFPFVVYLLVLNCGSTNGVREGKLPTGISVVMKNVPHTSIVTVLMMVKAGSIHETALNNGISRLVESSLFRISKNYRDIQWTLDSYGCKYRSATYNDFVYFSVTVDKLFLTRVLEIFADVVKNAEFPDSLVHRVKDELLSDINLEYKNPVLQLRKLFLKKSFQVHPYRFLPLGTMETIQNLKSKDVREYYENLYIPQNITIVIVGNFERRQVLRILKKSLGSFWRIPLRTYHWASEPEQTVPREEANFHSFPRNIAFFTIGWRAPSIRDPDTYSMDILTAALGIGESSILNTQIRDQMDSVYFIWAEYMTPREPGYFLINIVCRPSAVEEVKKRIFREIDILSRDSITPKALKRAKMYLEAQEAYSREGTMESAFYLGFWSVMKDIHFVKTYLPNIRKVSLQMLKKTASKYLKSNNYTSVVLLPSEKR